MHRLRVIISLCALIVTGIGGGCTALPSMSAPQTLTVPPMLTITGVAKDVQEDSQFIVLDEPSHQVSILWLTSSSTIQNRSGQAVSLKDVRPGATLEATGQSQSDNILTVAILIVVANPDPTPSRQPIPTATALQTPISATGTPISENTEHISLTGRITSVSLSAGILELAEPASGITVIALTDRTEIIGQDNQPVTLLDILPGMEITASGTRGSNGALIANTVHIISQEESGITITAPVTGVIVPNPVHVQGTLRLISADTRLVARVIDGQEQIVGESHLELGTDVTERVFIVTIPYSMTLSGPGTIEILALKTDDTTAAQAAVEVILVPPQAKPIEGCVMEVITETQTIRLAAPVDGFERIVLTDETRILTADGAVADLAEIGLEATIRITGHSGDDGELVAVEIQVIKDSDCQSETDP